MGEVSLSRGSTAAGADDRASGDPAEERTLTDRRVPGSRFVAAVLMIVALSAGNNLLLAATGSAENASAAYAAQQRDGSHDFDFLIGDWKAHVRRLPDRLNGSDAWDVYDGISNHKKLLDTNANFEEFDVRSADRKLHIKAQTLRVYNPETHQWSIYGLDLDNGQLKFRPSSASSTETAASSTTSRRCEAA